MAAAPRRFAISVVSIAVFTAAQQPGEAQSVSDRVGQEASQAPSSATVSLSSDADIRRHYDQLQRALRGLNADELARLYDDYRAALTALNEEHAKLSGTLLEQNRVAHAALRGETLGDTARSQRTREIQEAYSAATAERQAWYSGRQRELAARYESDRADRRALLDTEISTLSAQMNTALGRLRAGAGSVTAPAAVGLPGGASLPGPALPASASNPLADDERLQAVVPDIVLHSIQWDLSGNPGGNGFGFMPSDPMGTLAIDSCTHRIAFQAGYIVHLGEAPTEGQVEAVPIDGFMRLGRQELARISEQPYFGAAGRRVPDRLNPVIEQPHGFGWIIGEADVGFGEHTVTIVVDDANRVIESNETNNGQSARFLVIPDPDVELDCAANTIMSATVPDESPASGRAADIGATSETAIPDENAARAALSAANLVVELDTPMSRSIRVTNTGRTATDAPASMTISCRNEGGEPCLPSYALQSTLAEPVTIPSLEPGATHEHFIGSWPHAALWGPGRYTFEVELNANSAVAESARGNFATSSLTGANHAPGVIVDYCQGCHRSDNRGDGPPPYELVEWEAEEGLDALVEAVIDGPVGMGSKAEVFWLPDSNVHDVVRALLDRGR